MKLSSPAFENGEKIPKKYTGEGQDISPPLKWEDVPAQAEELFLLCEDPDAPGKEPFIHWLLYKIPTGQSSLDENNHGKALEGLNSFGSTGYGGPMPPAEHGPHHYHFRLFAVDQPLKLYPGASREQVDRALQGHILDEAEIVGTYER